MNYPELLASVQERAGLDRDGAEAATLATVRALSERITAQETQDLLSELPQQVKERIPVTSRVEDLSIDEFFERVGRFEEVSVEQARHHARTVLGVLREAVSAGELRDVFSELPSEYGELLP